jgi:hypothetical protein
MTFSKKSLILIGISLIFIIATLKKSLVVQTYDMVYAQIINNPNEVILKYASLPYDYSFGSQVIPLIIAGLMVDGDFLELGLAIYSTPILHKIATDKKNIVISIDTKSDWVDKFKFYTTTSNHRVLLMTYDEMSKFGLDKNWGLVLVDHGFADKRHSDILNYANKSQIIIAHDAEDAADFMYKYKEKNIRSYFK